MSAKAAGKIRTPSWDGHTAFHQQNTPYAHPPESIRSSTSLPTASPGSSASVPQKPNSTLARIKNDLYEKLSDFMCETEGRMKEAGDQRTRRYVAKLNYAVQDKELAMQHELLATESANADLVHRRELDHVQKDIELKNAEEHLIARQVQMLQLQIQLEEMRQRGHGQSSSSGL